MDRSPRMGALGTALTDQEQPNAFQKIRRNVHTFGEKDIGLTILLVNLHFAGQQNRGRFRRTVFDSLNQFAAINSWHDQIGEHKIHATLREPIQSLLSVGVGQHSISARFQHYFSNGERLFVVINAEDRPFRLHIPSTVRQKCGAKIWRLYG